MLTFKTYIRVRYADTDKMTFVYNGKYLEYFEVGRTELLRSVGLTYNEIEKNGFQLPLIEAGLKYKTPATYDDLLEVEATVTALYSPKVHIEYTIRKEGTDTVVCEGFTTHIFMRAETKRAVKPPQIYIDVLKPYFEPIV